MFKQMGFKARLWALLLVVSLLIFPASASAGRTVVQKGSMFVPPAATETYTLTVGRVSVSIPPGAMPEGGRILLQVRNKDGWFQAKFSPDREFQVPVIMDFGEAEVVYYHEGREIVPIVTEDLDGDGAVGEIASMHFSRYSGFY